MHFRIFSSLGNWAPEPSWNELKTTAKGRSLGGLYHVHIHIHVYLLCIYIHTYISIYIYIHVYLYTCIFVCIYIYILRMICMYTCVFLCTFTRMNTVSATRTRRLPSEGHQRQLPPHSARRPRPCRFLFRLSQVRGASPRLVCSGSGVGVSWVWGWHKVGLAVV